MTRTARPGSSKRTKAPSQSVVERLLLAKALLAPIRLTPEGKPDSFRLARHVLSAHDAAELALAAIAEHAGKTESIGTKGPAYLMDYAAAMGKLNGKEFLRQLNQVRGALKHQGILPSPQQWFRVGEKTYDYVSTWCKEYVGLSLDDLDEASLLTDEQVRKLLADAREAVNEGDYRLAFLNLALAEYWLFRTSPALRNLEVGNPRADDAVKVVAYGVPAADYLRLQEFLPRAVRKPDGSFEVQWDQTRFDHPGNWRKEAAEFCVNTFLSVAVCLQHAEAPPLPVHFSVVYRHRIKAKQDGVKIWTREGKWYEPFEQRGPKKTVKVLAKGDTLTGHVSRPRSPPFARLFPGVQEPEGFLHFWNDELEVSGYVAEEDVEVTCVPRDDQLVREYFPDLHLPEIPFE